MRRALRAAALALVACSAAASVERAGVELPETVRAGDRSLALASCGVRDTLWIEHYVAALYLLPGVQVAEALRDPRQPKAILMHVVRAAYLPERIPEKYRVPLADELRREPLARVRAAYRSLAAGDRVWITYAPSTGLTIAVNDRVIARAPGHALIESTLRTWAGEDPLSGKLRRLLLEHPC